MTESMKDGLPSNIVKTVTTAIDNANEELRNINLQIWNNPEVMFEEFKAADLLSSWFESKSWTVKRGVYGIETAFEARFSVKEGGRTVCYNAEYDALPGIGHACGHNLIATSTLASAIGVAAVMQEKQIPGTLVVMGTPAEETGGGKWIMANHGAWKDCDVCLMTHGMSSFSTPLFISKASWKFRAKFHGKGSHAAGAPWDGRNACDAIVHAYNGLALLRQHIGKDESIQGVILEAGKAPNVIPDYAEGSYSIRAKNSKGLYALKERIVPIFEGAAAATGCTVEVFWDALYEDVLSNRTLAERYRSYMLTELGLAAEDMISIDESLVKHAQNGSSDHGNCTYITPGIQALFSIKAEDMPHTPAFCEAAGKDFGHAEALRAGKANALIGLEVMLNDAFYQSVRVEWESSMKEAGRL
ncbi:putative amidohydrolase amhX [Aureobasidium pullulans]|nr:putative amidohydrolase amhX [Aureobasidium pullulans]THY91146.1 putative amidohydrolase amhX [Aureobasidium pullulans]